MRKLLAILFSFTLMTSCTSGEYTVDDYVVDLNWNSAVKDLYLMDTEISSDTAIEQQHFDSYLIFPSNFLISSQLAGVKKFTRFPSGSLDNDDVLLQDIKVGF